MTSCEADAARGESLEQLPRLAPDPDRAERVRRRCRTELQRSRRPAARMAATTGHAWHLLISVVVSGFCALYVVELVVTVLRLQGIVR